MDKMDMKTKNLADENYKKLAALFPEAITETITGYDENGKAIIERAIDADVLRQEIAASVVEGKDERYQFTWPDKKKSIAFANMPISYTLRPCKEKSVNFNETENLYIEGDNLHVLKLLQETYLEKIKVIYIDPPYNTGHDFVYNDDFSQNVSDYIKNSGQIDDYGNRLVQNAESNGRFHTDWLNMIYTRLKLARNLLSEDGAIFISIDDNEQSNLRKICDEIFGEDEFVSNISWQKVYSPKNNNIGISSEVEYVLCYSKNKEWVAQKLERTDKMNSMYKNPDNDIDGLWTSSDATAPGAATHQGMVYAIQNPFTGELCYPTRGCCWRKFQDDLLEIMNGWASYELKDLNDDVQRAAVCGISPDTIRKGVKAIVLLDDLNVAQEKAKNVLKNETWPIFYFTSNGQGSIRKKTYLKDMEGRTCTNFWPYSEVGHNDEAKKEVANLFDGHAPFDTPKPVRLIDRVLKLATEKDSIVLDFFSGSATLAQAVMSANAKDNGMRKYILVQLEEKSNNPNFENLCDVGEERIRRASKKIKQESSNVNFDQGFRVLRIDSSNMKDIYYNPAEVHQTSLFESTDNIKEDRTPEDLLFQVMLDLGVLLSSKIEETEICGKKVFNVAEGFLVACFDTDVSEDVVKEIAQMKPYYAVLRDGSMASDSVATNFDQIFETFSPETVRKVL